LLIWKIEGRNMRNNGFVILYRNTNSGRVWFVSDGEDEVIYVFPTEEEAENAARRVRVCQIFPYSIVEAP
jgi:hypothetical protein